MSRRRLIPVALAVLAAAGLTSASCHTEVHRVRYDPAPRPLAVAQQPAGEQAALKARQPMAVSIGADVPPAIAKRAVELLQQVNGAPVTRLARDADEARTDGTRTLPANTLVISLGDSALTRSLIPQEELHQVGSEGFILRSKSLPNGSTLIAADGNPAANDLVQRGQNRGAAYATYAVLEELGFSFLHPLQPTLPDALATPSSDLNRVEHPRWPVRMIHLHTQHPLELTDLLQGFGPGGPKDREGWEQMLGDWDRALEWMVANRLNRVEWILLDAASWRSFADSDERFRRMAILAEHAHTYGIEVGLDVPIAFQQQHAYRLLRSTGTEAHDLDEIKRGVDRFMLAGFDFLSTETGTTEFTHPDAKRMLGWMNAFADRLAEHWHRPSYIKVHASTGQSAHGYTDPKTGAALNFNLLPHYASPNLGVMPHTVQHYGLTDPAPTYANSDFGYMRQFLQEEVGRREVLWYPETSYWVSFDVDVPLFLPLYADRRLSDLRLLAQDEEDGRMGRGEHANGQMNGQVFFSSGWEWGYWLNDVIAARASWDPGTSGGSQDDALARSLESVTRAFGPADKDVRDWLVDVVRAQRSLLIEGRVNGVAPKTPVKRNGQAYLQGTDALDDMQEAGTHMPFGSVQPTQPLRLNFEAIHRPAEGDPDYQREIAPLLTEMEHTFSELSARGDQLRARIPASARPLFNDLADAMKMTALRARQVHALYDYADSNDGDGPRKPHRLADARRALDEAAQLVKERELHYRVDPDRIASWRDNPTAYRFEYLWTVRTLYYWWRDEAKATEQPVNPCFMNIVDPIDIAVGGGSALDLLGSAARFSECAGTPAPPALPLHRSTTG